MKLRSLLPRNLRKVFFRAITYNPFYEFFIQKLIIRPHLLNLPEIGLKTELVKTDILLDLGANIGNVTSRFAKTGAKVFAFEPDPIAFLVLKRRFKYINNVTCFNFGVMSKPGKLNLYFCNPDSNDRIQSSIGSSFFSYKRKKRSEIYQAVECISLVDFLIELNKPIKLIKMDIEGSEVEVLNSLIDSNCLDAIEKIVVETHEDQIPELKPKLKSLKKRIISLGKINKIDFNWI